MAKVVDITEKLSFDENPVMVIGGNKLEVKSDADVMLKIVGIFSSSNGNDMQAVSDALELIFDKDDLQKILSMEKNGKKLSAKSLMVIIQEAVSLVMGDNEPGEQ